MKDVVIPYTLPEAKDHSFFYIAQHVPPHVEAKMHCHEAWELYYVTHGQGTRMTGDTLMPFLEGDVVLIPPSMPHYWEYEPESANTDGEITYLMVAFSQEFINKSMSMFPEIKRELLGCMTPTEAIKYGEVSARIIKCALRKMRELGDIGQLCEMLRLLPTVFTTDDHIPIGKPIKIDRDIRRIRQVATYVMAHYPHPISLDDISAHLGMNRSAFCSFFKRHKGITFSRFVTQYRLSMACELLRDRQKQVSEICFAVGFNDRPHFNRMFRKEFGMSPSQFRSRLS